MEYITLNNGVKMPKLGYGVYQIDPAKDASLMQFLLATVLLIRRRLTVTKKA